MAQCTPGGWDSDSSKDEEFHSC
jgi:hypothetical protein